MRKPLQVTAFASAVAAALLAVSTLYAQTAHDKGGPMMGHGMMGRGGMMGGMDQMMDHCRQMMGGGSTRPNEQWKKETPKTPEKKG